MDVDADAVATGIISSLAPSTAEDLGVEAADEETHAYLRDEDARAAAGGDWQGHQQARGERRAREIGPSSETNTSGVILMSGRDAVLQQAFGESAPERAASPPPSI
jgi:hypothetical protein